MKIRNKLAFSFLSIILLLITSIITFNALVVRNRTLEEKNTTYTALAQQTLLSYKLLTDGINQTLFNAYLSMGLPEAIRENPTNLLRTKNIEEKLQYLVWNSSYLDNVTAIDLNGSRYRSSRSGNNDAPAIPEELVETILEKLQKQTVVWVRGETGRIFLCKQLYSVFPLKHLGYIIAEIESQYLYSVLGIDQSLDGFLLILNRDGQPLIANRVPDSQVFQQAKQYIVHSTGYTADGTIPNRTIPTVSNLAGDDYLMVTETPGTDGWTVLYLVPMKTVLKVPSIYTRLNIVAGIIAAFFTAALAYLISTSLTRNIKALLLSIEEVNKGNLALDIKVSGTDEIGLLSENFNTMLHRLNEITNQIIVEADLKQKTKYELLELKYRSFQAQVSPHFICNILSSINALAIMGEVDKVVRLSIRASEYLRDNLNNNERKYTTVRKELRSISDYIRLYRDIYDADFRFSVKVEPAARDLVVPNMLLQPLIENSLIHGQQDIHEKQFAIFIKVSLMESRLEIQVGDNGCGFNEKIIRDILCEAVQSDSKQKHRFPGYGTRSVLQRLRLLYQQDFTFDIQSEPGKGSLIIINIPRCAESAMLMEGRHG